MTLPIGFFCLLLATLPGQRTSCPSQTLQRQIDALAAQGGGTLTIPRGVHRTGALFFKKGVNLHLDEGAVLLGTDDAADYPLRETRIEGRTRLYYPALINADGCDGFRITGSGTIDGHGLPTWKAFWAWYEKAKRSSEPYDNADVKNGLVRPRLLYVSNSKNVDISGVTFKNSKFWTTHYYRCENVFIHDCTIQAEILDGVKGPSTDAIDLDVVKHVLVSNVVMDVNDDAVVVKGGKGTYAHDPKHCPENGPSVDVKVVDCLFKSVCHHCLTLGSECVGASNVRMYNCRVEGANALLYLKLRSDTMQWYSGIRVDRVTGSVKNVFRVKPWRTRAHEPQPEIVRKSFVDGVTLANLDLDCERFFDTAPSDDYELKNLRLLSLWLRCTKDASYDRTLFANTYERGNRIDDWSAWGKLAVQVKSSLDGTLQPGLVWLPEKAKTEKVPLLVALHSWSYGYQMLDPARWALDEAKKRGWGFYYPHFRGPNKTPQACGSDLAVQDIVDGVRHVGTLGQIDADRVYLLGGSGGGHMALLMAGRHPEIWAAVYAACPITDVGRWHDESGDTSRDLEPIYARMLEGVCGAGPSSAHKRDYDRRSPVTWLKNAKGVAVDIITGIHDGHRRPKGGGSVPCGHAVRGFNCLANEADRIPESVIAEMEKTEKVPPEYAFHGSDPFFPVPRREIYLRRTSGNARLTLFNAGHSGNYTAAADWFTRQRRGRPADWTVPQTSQTPQTPQISHDITR